MTVPTWAGTDQWRAESAAVRRAADGFTARGVQLGIDPLPYRVDYHLDTAGGWVTRTLEVTAAGNGRQRTLHLAHDAHGRWTCEATTHGEVTLPQPGGDAEALTGTLDCDLGLSPLTNTLPIVRRHLHREAGVADFTMAWVSVPDLWVHASIQRYKHLRTIPAGAVIRYRGGDFTADVVVNADGFVTEHPELVPARPSTASRHMPIEVTSGPAAHPMTTQPRTGSTGTHVTTLPRGRAQAEFHALIGDPSAVLAPLAARTPHLASALESTFDDVLAEPGLPRRAREVATLAALAALGGSASELDVHTRARP